jgi:hypothetical protein
MRAEKQVFRVNTCAVVTFVQNEEPIRDGTAMKLIRHTVSKELPTANTKAAVTARAFTSGPFPTSGFVVRLHLLQKALVDRS